MECLFENRAEAAARLVQRLKRYRSHAVALAVGVGAVPVAVHVARHLHLPLGFVPVVSLKGPDGLAFGALAPGGSAVVEWSRFERVGEVGARAIVAHEQVELARLEEMFGEFTRVPVGLRNAILISDGIDTGMTMRAAVRAVRLHHPAQVIATAPVISEQAERHLREEACECVTLVTCAVFGAPGACYREFSPHAPPADALRLLAEASALVS